MMSVTFYVGEQPSDPLVVTVRDSAGNVRDLTDVTAVDFVGGDLPAGDAAVSNAALGKVQYDFDAPFTVAENLRLQVELTTADGTDLSAPFTLIVQDPADVAATLVTPAQVEQWTTVSVSESDVVRAQGIVCLATGRDLYDPDTLALIGTKDTFWLGQAIAWQAAFNPEGVSPTVTLPYVPGASSITNGDVSISYFEGGASDLSGLAPNARLALKRLSWMKPIRTVSALPFLSERGLQPDPWVPMYRGV
jgi:hypothetical protein